MIEQVFSYIAQHPDQTTEEIAEGLGHPFERVQMLVCDLINDDRVTQPGKRELDNGKLRPVYRVKLPLSHDPLPQGERGCPPEEHF
ncbi:MAG: hypothetical protein AB1560_02075 [Pseudomonadota bacterium]